MSCSIPAGARIGNIRPRRAVHVTHQRREKSGIFVEYHSQASTSSTVRREAELEISSSKSLALVGNKEESDRNTDESRLRPLPHDFTPHFRRRWHLPAQAGQPHAEQRPDVSTVLDPHVLGRIAKLVPPLPRCRGQVVHRAERIELRRGVRVVHWKCIPGRHASIGDARSVRVPHKTLLRVLRGTGSMRETKGILRDGRGFVRRCRRSVRGGTTNFAGVERGSEVDCSSGSCWHCCLRSRVIWSFQEEEER
mmetsp:Transcript_22522/g.36541  ORF Transcript_22522/g.36541 Transcript_22522/m.36541 type:complete len:251 (-) Transcript_22522:202-954(-)